jgi:hypothetical protein
MARPKKIHIGRPKGSKNNKHKSKSSKKEENYGCCCKIDPQKTKILKERLFLVTMATAEELKMNHNEIIISVMDLISC